MIDLHSHLLPGIDDGARTIDDTLDVVRNTLDSGVTHVMCTPHVHLGIFNNNKDTIQKSFAIAVQALRKSNIPLKLAFSCEVRICPEIIPLVQSDKLPFLGMYNNKKVLLLELPHSHVPPGTENLIKWLLKQNIQPVIPHPERNREILVNNSKIRWLKQLGCLFQVTAGAFVGRFSDKSAELAWKMLDDGYINYVASDTHNVKKRPNDMQLAFDEVSEYKGLDMANQLFKTTPKMLTANVKWY